MKVDFVCRVKDFKYKTLENNYQTKEDKIVMPTGVSSGKKYPKAIRLVKFTLRGKGETYMILTNNFKWTASTVAELHGRHWEIERFFQRIKKDFNLNTLLGMSENAVKTQVWVAMTPFLLIEYLKDLSQRSL